MNSYIRSTKNYAKFERHQFNRNLKFNWHRQELEDSMKQHGWILAYPMHCIRDENKIVIKDGHQRMSAAMKLGISVKFIVCDDDIKISDLIGTVNPWTLQDFLDSHVRAGKPDYVKVKEYAEDTNLSLGASISLLAGKNAGSSHQIHKFKRGQFRLGDPQLAQQMKEIVLDMHVLGIPFATNSLLVQAIAQAIWVKEFSIRQFRYQLSKYNRFLQKRPNIDAYIKNLEQIYNHRNPNKIPLVFMAEEAAKERLAATKAILTEE